MNQLSFEFLKTYQAYAGGTFNILTPAHIKYLQATRMNAADTAGKIFGYIPGIDKVSLNIFLSATSSRDYQGKKALYPQEYREHQLISHPMLEGVIDSVIRLSGDYSTDLQMRTSLHSLCPEPFIYYFGDDQAFMDWAIQLRHDLKSIFKERVYFIGFRNLTPSAHLTPMLFHPGYKGDLSEDIYLCEDILALNDIFPKNPFSFEPYVLED